MPASIPQSASVVTATSETLLSSLRIHFSFFLFDSLSFVTTVLAVVSLDWQESKRVGICCSNLTCNSTECGTFYPPEYIISFSAPSSSSSSLLSLRRRLFFSSFVSSSKLRNFWSSEQVVNCQTMQFTVPTVRAASLLLVSLVNSSFQRFWIVFLPVMSFAHEMSDVMQLISTWSSRHFCNILSFPFDCMHDDVLQSGGQILRQRSLQWHLQRWHFFLCCGQNAHSIA